MVLSPKKLVVSELTPSFSGFENYDSFGDFAVATK